MRVSQAGRDFIKGFEGLRLQAYPDQRGIPTIGWGHTAGVCLGMEITLTEAETFFSQDLAPLETILSPENPHSFIKVPLTQNQFDAICSLTFNLINGVNKVRNSTLVVKLNRRDFQGAGEEFPRWDHFWSPSLKDFVVDPGLSRRRKAEMELFLRP